MSSMMRLVPLGLDVLFVLIFSALGRMSHGESPLGVFVTAWPFLVACLVAWVIIAALGDMGAGWRAGVVSWLVTWLGGIAVRLMSDTSAAVAFILVAGGMLALFLLGWRACWTLIERRRAAQA